MKKILVTTDFSANSKAGIRFAIQLASQARCELIFFNVIQLTDINVWTDRNYTDFSGIDIEVQKDKLRKFIMAVYRQSGKEAGKVDFAISNTPDVDASIIAYAKKIGANFICMSTRGGGIINKFMGTNASALMATSPLPIFVIPHGYRSKPMKSVLYASDLQNIALELHVVEEFATTFQAHIAVYNYDEFNDKEDIRNKFNTIGSKYQSPKVAFHFQKFNIEHSLVQHLQDDIRKSKPSLVAMFTRQDRTWFERIFLSSKTAELGFDTRTPLLVFRK